MSPWPKAEDIIELNISDISVPIETRVIPITRLEIPKEEANLAEFVTAILLEIAIIIIPMINKKIEIPIPIILFSYLILPFKIKRIEFNSF
jgi:hypothetical protein